MYNEVLEGLVVVKRSGQRVEFNASKIAIAVKKAFDAVYGESNEKQIYKVFEKVLTFINNNYKDRKTINVEDIQDIIENVLKEEKFENVFSSFKEYRQKRAASRKVFNEKQQHKFVKAIEKVEEESNNQDNSLTPNQILNKFGKIISYEYAKSYILDAKYVRALEEGNIYIHNLDFFSLGYIPYINLKLEIKNDDEYLDDFINEIVSAQKEVSYEIGINLIDNLLGKYALRKYKILLKKYLKKYLKLNGLYEFINFKRVEECINKIEDICDVNESLGYFITNNTLKNIINTAIDDTYEDILNIISATLYRIFNALRCNYKENSSFNLSVGYSDLLINSLFRENIISYLNDNNYLNNIHVIFKITSEMDDTYLSKISSLIINKKNVSLAFVKNSYNSETFEAEYFSNGLRIFENVNDSDKKATGRMIVANTSINLARLGLKYLNKTKKEFYEELDQILDFVKNELLLSFETIGNKNKENYNVLFNGNILGDERLETGQKIRKILKTGNLSIGLIGLKECILALEPNEDKQYNLLIELLDYFNDKCKKFSEDTKLNFNIFEPSDKSSRKYLIAIDKSIYGNTKKLTDKDMYELIDTFKFMSDYKVLANVQKRFKGGNLVTIKASSKITNKKIVDLIKDLIDADIGFVQIDVGGK